MDSRNRVFAYRNMYICDGSVRAANLGVNPSLTMPGWPLPSACKAPTSSVTSGVTSLFFMLFTIAWLGAGHR